MLAAPWLYGVSKSNSHHIALLASRGTPISMPSRYKTNQSIFEGGGTLLAGLAAPLTDSRVALPSKAARQRIPQQTWNFKIKTSMPAMILYMICPH